MLVVAHKGTVVSVRVLPAEANPHVSPTLPQGSSGQLPLRVTAGAPGENNAPTSSWNALTIEPPRGWKLCLLLKYSKPWDDYCVVCCTLMGTFRSASFFIRVVSRSLFDREMK